MKKLSAMAVALTLGLGFSVAAAIPNLFAILFLIGGAGIGAAVTQLIAAVLAIVFSAPFNFGISPLAL